MTRTLRRVAFFAVLSIVLFPLGQMPEAQADFCVNPRVIIINYTGWYGPLGNPQCGGPLGPPLPPTSQDVIGQKIIACDGSYTTWGTICEPDNGYNQYWEYGEECDCGPDQ